MYALPASMLSDAPFAFFALNDRRGVIFWNPAAERLLCRKASEVIGRTVQIPACDGRDVLAVMADGVLARCERSSEEIFRLDSKASSIVVRACAWPMRNTSHQVTGVVVALMERLDPQQPDGATPTAYLHMLRTSRLTTLGQMASGLVHEINQPICAIGMAIEGGLRMLRSGQDLATMPLDEALTIASMETHRAREILRRFGDFARARKNRKANIRIERVIRDTLELARIDPEFQQVSVIWEPPRDLPAVRADSVQIQQVLLNLIRNSVDSMAMRDPEERVLTIEAHPIADAMVEVCVSDTGRAVPPEELALLFEPFYTTKPHGMGMGLAVSRMIIDAHGGHLQGRPNGRNGMTFCFTLPYAQESCDDAIM